MSAADRMVVRTRDGYRSVPRRAGLGMIAAGRAAHAPQAPVQDTEAPTVPPTPEPAHTAPQRAQTPSQIVDAAPEPVTITGTTDEIAATMDALAPVRELPPEPKPTARRGEWADYADSLGVEVTSTMTKREIQQAAEEAATSLANLPQPALTGGRLETPEDEPVTDGSVTDDEDPGTR